MSSRQPALTEAGGRSEAGRRQPSRLSSSFSGWSAFQVRLAWLNFLLLHATQPAHRCRRFSSLQCQPASHADAFCHATTSRQFLSPPRLPPTASCRRRQEEGNGCRTAAELFQDRLAVRALGKGLEGYFLRHAQSPSTGFLPPLITAAGACHCCMPSCLPPSRRHACFLRRDETGSPAA